MRGDKAELMKQEEVAGLLFDGQPVGRRPNSLFQPRLHRDFRIYRDVHCDGPRGGIRTGRPSPSRRRPSCDDCATGRAGRDPNPRPDE